MIQIIADTTCSIPLDQLAAKGIEYLPQVIVFGDQSYRDDYEIDTATFLQKLQASPTLPKTAAPPPALYNPLYQKYLDQGDSVLVITPSAEVSGTFRSAEVAAQDFPGADIHIVDSRTAAGGLGSIVLQAKEWALQGMPMTELIENVKELSSRGRVYFLVDTLENLRKGGRIGGAQALLGSLLQVKPLLTLKDGKIDAVESQRTKKKAVARLKDIIYAECPHNKEGSISVSHCGAEEEAIQLANEIGRELNIQNIPVYLVPPAIVVHAGPGVLAISFFVAPAGEHN
jgi:DegV family protein with EDD domain